MKYTLALFYLSAILILGVSSRKKYQKELLKEEDTNQSEAIALAKEQIQFQGAELKVLAIYSRIDRFEYSYLIHIARIIDDSFTVHSITIICTRDSYWSAGVFNAVEESMISLSFHMPLYTLLQDIIEKYYLRRSLYLKHLGFIQQCGLLYITRSVLRNQKLIEIIVLIEAEGEGKEEVKEKYAIETVFTLN